MTPSPGNAWAAGSLQDAAILVLAAGRSTRMGSPKALIEFESIPLLEHLLSAPLFREFGDVLVVLGHHAEALRPVVARLGYRYLVNPHPDRGRTGSVQLGLGALRAAVRRVFVQPVDCPLISPQTYLALLAAMGRADVAIPAYQGRGGHPPLLSTRLIPSILAARSDEPLRDLLHAREVSRRLVEVEDPGVLVNIDRPEDLQQLISLRAVRGTGAG